MSEPELAVMTTGGALFTASFLRRYWLLLTASVLFVAPALVALGRDVWSTEQGAQGPIILATGLWLLWSEARVISARPDSNSTLIALVLLVLLGVVAVFGAIIGKLWLQWAAIYAILVVTLYSYVGFLGLKRLWFPLCYLMFLIPPPQGLIVPLTRGLKLSIAGWAVDVLSVVGYQVASTGASLFIDSYELVVAAACSGLNSLTSLLAVGLFYIYLLHRAHWMYAAVLALLIVPIAIITNLIRIIILLLVTHYFGDKVAQGMLHEAAGIMMFFIALQALALVDFLLSSLVNRRGRKLIS